MVRLMFWTQSVGLARLGRCSTWSYSGLELGQTFQSVTCLAVLPYVPRGACADVVVAKVLTGGSILTWAQEAQRRGWKRASQIDIATLPSHFTLPLQQYPEKLKDPRDSPTTFTHARASLEATTIG